MNKRGFELSINFVVMLILAIAVFSGGIYIASKFFSYAEKETFRMDEQTNRQIEQLLNDGSRVAVPINKKKTTGTGFVTFGVGVLNVLGVSPAPFTINVKFNSAYKKDNTQISLDAKKINKWLKSANAEGSETGLLIDDINILNNEQKTYLIGIQMEAEQGTYIFDLDVHCSAPVTDCEGDNKYDNTHKLYVEVI